jgi:deoxyribodipyrimidine photo-lyase
MAKRDVECRRFGGSLLYEPEALATGSGQPYRVFTPFWRACLGQPPVRAPLPAPPDMSCVDRSPRSLPLDHWLLPKPDWAAGLRATWTPGEAGARLRLQRFLGGPIEDYDQERDRPDLEATSMLSPHLHHGEISPRQCWHAASMAIESGSATSGA